MTQARTAMMIRPVIRHNMQMSLFATCHFQYFVQKSLFYVPSNVFRHLNIGVKTMKCFCSVWLSTLCQTAAITAYASCSFKRWELRRGSWLTQGQSHLFHYISYRRPHTGWSCLDFCTYTHSSTVTSWGDSDSCLVVFLFLTIRERKPTFQVTRTKRAAVSITAVTQEGVPSIPCMGMKCFIFPEDGIESCDLPLSCRRGLWLPREQSQITEESQVLTYEVCLRPALCSHFGMAEEAPLD